MSGGNVPYHLRQNKAIDRGVFVDTLSRISRATPDNIKDYRYIGFAGPFSEDFKLVHSQLGLSRFTSIEMSEVVLKRQQWNTPLRGVDYRHCSARDFIDGYDALEPSIIWLDYASPSDLPDQLSEVESLVAKMNDYDVLKITLNVSHSNLHESGPGPLSPEVTEKRIETARLRLGDYLPAGIEVTSEDVDRHGYPALIMKGAERAIKTGMEGKRTSRFQLLTAFTYSDSAHRMLTLTGVILPRGKVTAFLRSSGISQWKLAVTKWNSDRTEPIEIVIPDMSLRERLFVEQQLPRRGSAKQIMKKLGFKLLPGVDEKTVAALTSFKNFYRYFPHFSRMVL